jgi:hypothetical protein
MANQVTVRFKHTHPVVMLEALNGTVERLREIAQEAEARCDEHAAFIEANAYAELSREQVWPLCQGMQDTARHLLERIEQVHHDLGDLDRNFLASRLGLTTAEGQAMVAEMERRNRQQAARAALQRKEDREAEVRRAGMRHHLITTTSPKSPRRPTPRSITIVDTDRCAESEHEDDE